MASSKTSCSFTDDEVSQLASCDDQAEFLYLYLFKKNSPPIKKHGPFCFLLSSMLKQHSVLPLTVVPRSLRGSLRLSLTRCTLRWALLFSNLVEDFDDDATFLNASTAHLCGNRSSRLSRDAAFKAMERNLLHALRDGG